jgi:hypothetical protein
MIKSNPLAVVLVTALFLSALASSWFSLWWFLGAKELQGLEYQFQSLNQISAAMQSLANDAVEYSRRNPAMDSVLNQFDLKSRPVAPPVSAPPTLKDAR